MSKSSLVSKAIQAQDTGIDFSKMKFGQVSVGAKSNIVTKEALRDVQLWTLEEIEKSLAHTFGPTASSTAIITGSDASTLVTNYSKDGRKCLKHIMFSNPIELSIRTQLDDIVSHVDQEVGDGTTSATLLSAEIFKMLCVLENEKGKARYPYKVSRDFKKAVALIQDKIKTHARELTIDDVYKIAFISTNGNEEIAQSIKSLYEEFGLDCYIETGISTTEDDIIKMYDGMTLPQGYSDSAYINTNDGKSSIRDPKLYVFQDPIDTTEMGAFLDKIISDNIIVPAMNEDPEAIVPTVIVAPKISRDMSSVITRLVDYLYQFDSQGDLMAKPPILIVTNLTAYVDEFLDIGKLSGAKFIKKYIDPEIQKQDIEKGLAPTPETIHEFAGHCDLVEANIGTTKFVNPANMYEHDVEGHIITDEDDKPIPTVVLKNLLEFLENQIKDSKEEGAGDAEVYALKKRLQSLKANMVEFNVGGITIADRDEAKDLIDDAVKSCRSAANSGVGFGANFEGFRAVTEILDESEDLDEGVKDMLDVILRAYTNVISRLYGSLYENKATVDSYILGSIENGSPLNLTTGEFDKCVLTSIDTDIKILDAISKIVTLMFTTEQCYVQVPALNHYSV